MEHLLDLTGCGAKVIRPLSEHFRGEGPDGVLAFTNYYMERNGVPFFGISGECHYSRLHEEDWEDTILQMKMGGINIVSTYVFWNHHEEEEGSFRFDGRRNIRQFIQLCHKHCLSVIVRIGPFDHGEVRNGGLPDWLYGKPFDVRSLDPGFLSCVRRLYGALAEQFASLYFKDGGPIIAAQIENEYMHSAAPWEMTTGVSNEWVPAGSEGNAYMLALKRLAVEAGIVTPFYTCTGWGGAATPTEEMLPLWGGYAFWPWIFYDYRGEHPVTPEYLYRQYHDNSVPKIYNFEPTYAPESLPYACCEMGGGMACYYHYRFQLPYESVDAMANVKLAGGCNFLGYYMYRGGTNPKGLRTPYLNEFQCPKLSYDYQAPIGEFGQLRPSYHRLRALHSFLRNFGEGLCRMDTVLPAHASQARPEDVDTLRYAVRTDGASGYLFLNNYQDHVVCKDKTQESITLKLREGTVEFPSLSIAAGEEAILPFGMDMQGYWLLYANAQPLSVLREGERTVYFFFQPKGMEPEFVWRRDGIVLVDGVAPPAGDTVRVAPTPGPMSTIDLNGEHGAVRVVLLTREQSLMFYEVEMDGEKMALLCNTPVTQGEGGFTLETPHDDEETVFCVYPSQKRPTIQGAELEDWTQDGIWTGGRVCWGSQKQTAVELPVRQVSTCRYVVEVPKGYEDSKELLLQIRYEGDIGNAFVDGELIHDNFCNGAVWEIGLKAHRALIAHHPVTITVTPLKENCSVNVSSAMAGRVEEVSGQKGGVQSVHLKPVYQATLRFEQEA